MKNNRNGNLCAIATRLRGATFLIAIAFTATSQAQFTRMVDVQFTGVCNALPRTIGIVLNGDEANQFSVYTKDDGHWIGELPSSLLAIEASSTTGSARLRGARTDCQLSSRAMYKGERVAAFTFNCDEHTVNDVTIFTTPEIPFGYVRTLPLNPTIYGSCRCVEARASFGRQTIPDVRFSSESLSPQPDRTRSNPTAPFEDLRLQLLTRKPPGPKDCGLLINDPAVIAAANKGPIDAHELVRLFSNQRSRNKACQAPTLSSNAVDIDESSLPRLEVELKVKSVN